MPAKRRTFDVKHGHERETVGFCVSGGAAPEMAGFGGQPEVLDSPQEDIEWSLASAVDRGFPRAGVVSERRSTHRDAPMGEHLPGRTRALLWDRRPTVSGICRSMLSLLEQVICLHEPFSSS